MTDSPTIGNRTYSAAHFALELDGKKDVALFRSIEGGGVKTDVMTYQAGGIHEKWKQLGKPKFDDIKLQVGMSMSWIFFEWIQTFFANQGSRKNGAIVAADFYYKERARREFREALIKEVTFPKLDATDKGPAYMSVSLSVEEIIFKPGDGSALPNDHFENQKLWTSCNFRFTLDGFEDQCTRVAKIDSFTIKQNILEYIGGGMRHPTKSPSQMDYPNLSFYVPEADVQPFLDQFKRNAIDGNTHKHSDKVTGSLTVNDDQKNALFVLDLYETDIVSVTPDKLDSTSEEIKMYKIEIYVERIAFKYATSGAEGSENG